MMFDEAHWTDTWLKNCVTSTFVPKLFLLRANIYNATVAVYLRSLRIIAAEEKNIPGPSRELMDCK